MALSFKNSIYFLALAMTLCGSMAGAANEQPEEDWCETAGKSGLSGQDIERLREHRILVTNETYEQVFSAYLSSGKPLFITSDSLLNVYHVLHEESVRRIETRNAAKLPEILRFILNNLASADGNVTGRPALLAAAKRRAQVVVGTALRLLDDNFAFADKNLNSILAAEVSKVIEAKVVEKPDWLGRPDPGFLAIDYGRYKPRGFYTSLPLLERYFRSVAWLQSIPFRTSEDEELLAILMLGNCVSHSRFDDWRKYKEYETFFTAYRMFIGEGDDWDLMKASDEAEYRIRMDIARWRLEQTRKRAGSSAQALGAGPAINDQKRLPPADPNQVAEPNFRIISAYRTPSAVLFQRTTDLRRFKRPLRFFPDGLEVCVALGSPLARDLLKYKNKDKLLATIDKTKPVFRGESLYFSYLNALGALLDEPEPGAPGFMRGNAWQIKSCNTVLAGWAQLRHTWSLQAKQTAFYASKTTAPPGFIEPEPEFFSRMADLAEQTMGILDQVGAFGPDYTFLVPHLVKLEGLLEGVKTEDELKSKFYDQMRRDDTNFFTLFELLAKALPAQARRGSADYYAEKRQQFSQLLGALRSGGSVEFSAVTERYKLDLPSLWSKLVSNRYEFDLQSSWIDLALICRRLEAISHKQLRGIALNSSEESFIRGYGERIAAIMFYGGNSFLSPRDDAPRVVDVFTNAFTGPRPRQLHVGIGRARKLYVLYPWQGKDILCAGAVIPYYEFTSVERLTNSAWRELLDSRQRPLVPGWIAPILWDKGIGKPDLQKVGLPLPPHRTGDG
jgi:hypothetical protein